VSDLPPRPLPIAYHAALPATPPEAPTMLDAARTILIDGGWVMILLLILSLVTGAIVAERLWFWLQHDTRPVRARLDPVAELVREGRLRDARDRAGRYADLQSVFARELLARAHALGGPGATESAAHELIERARPAFERFGPTLSTVITAAPLLGILGTVVGIIASFQLLGGSGPVDDPTAVAAGIATALYTTAFGLLIALGALFPHTIFRTRADRLLARLEAFSALVIEHERDSMQASNKQAPRASEGSSKSNADGSRGARPAPQPDPQPADS